MAVAAAAAGRYASGMSSPHPTISTWERDGHEGRYQADLHSWQLTVSWTPNTQAARGSFSWTAQRGDAVERSHHSFEEMELAMADAELFARTQAAKDTHAIAAATE